MRALARRARRPPWRPTDLWLRPPPLRNPLIIQVAAGQTKFPRDASPAVPAEYKFSGTISHFNYDVDVFLDARGVELTATEQIRVYGGRNVRWCGGKITQSVPPSGGVSCHNVLGTFFCEGVHMDGLDQCWDPMVVRTNADDWVSGGMPSDTRAGIAIYQHCRVTGCCADPVGAHADVVQLQNTGTAIGIEEATWEMDEQGVIGMSQLGVDWCFLRKINTHYNLRGWMGSGTPDADELTSWWLHDGDTEGPTNPIYPSIIDQLYSTLDDSNDPAWTWHVDATFPGTSRSWGPVADASEDFVVFSRESPDLQVYGLGGPGTFGRVDGGQPPGGDFVPASTSGLNFVSPWRTPV